MAYRYKKYDKKRKGWVVYDENGHEVDFIRKTSLKEDLEGYGCLLLIVLFVIAAIATFASTHPVISGLYVILLVLCIAWRNKPGTMGTVSKILKFVLPVAAIAGVYFGFKGM